MSAPALLQQAQALGIKLSAVAGKLRIDAPAGALTPVLRTALIQHRCELLVLITSPPDTADAQAAITEAEDWACRDLEPWQFELEDLRDIWYLIRVPVGSTREEAARLVPLKPGEKVRRVVSYAESGNAWPSTPAGWH